MCAARFFDNGMSFTVQRAQTGCEDLNWNERKLLQYMLVFESELFVVITRAFVSLTGNFYHMKFAFKVAFEISWSIFVVDVTLFIKSDYILY